MSNAVPKRHRPKVVLPKAPTAWITHLKYRALAYVAAIAIAAVATVSIIGVPWMPVIGVAVAALAMSVSKMTNRLAEPTCLSCGNALKDEPIGAHGIACPSCGSVNSPGLVDFARLESEAPALPLAETQGIPQAPDAEPPSAAARA